MICFCLIWFFIELILFTVSSIFLSKTGFSNSNLVTKCFSSLNSRVVFFILLSNSWILDNESSKFFFVLLCLINFFSLSNKRFVSLFSSITLLFEFSKISRWKSILFWICILRFFREVKSFFLLLISKFILSISKLRTKFFSLISFFLSLRLIKILSSFFLLFSKLINWLFLFFKLSLIPLICDFKLSIWFLVFNHFAINSFSSSSLASLCVSLYVLAFFACFWSSERFFFLADNISFNLSIFLLVASNLLVVSFFLALIPDIPAASSKILLRSIGFCNTKLPMLPWSIMFEDLEPDEKSANKNCISLALTSLPLIL